MSLKEELTDAIYRFILTSALALLLFLEIYDFLDPELITKGNVLLTLLISLFLNAFLVLYHKIKFYLIPAVVLVFVAVSFFMSSEDLELLLNSNILKLFIITTGAFIVFLIADAFPVVSLLIAVGFLAYYFVLLLQGIDPEEHSPAFAFFYNACFITKFIRNRMKQGDAKRTRSYMTFLMPFLLILPLTLAVLPKSENPISWDWAVRLYENAVDKINEIIHDISLKFSSSGKKQSFNINFGYSEVMTYNNSDISNASKVLEFTPGNPVYGDIYFKGEVFNTFADGKWSNTIVSDKDYSSIDAFETYYGIELFDPMAQSSITRSNTVNIRYLDFTSDILFTPAKNVIIRSKELNDELHFKDEHLLFNEMKTYGTAYRMEFLVTNYISKAFKAYITTPLADDRAIFKQTQERYYDQAYSYLTFEDLLSYREYVRSNYTSSPEIRQSVTDWLAEVTKDSESDYEKLRKLEYALSLMKYTLSDGELPSYVKSEGDFLNYFIIEKQAGYCVHYATAFCLLARALGYPARVIQGYKAPGQTLDTVPIYSSYGHAWPEVYFEGKGWIAFEPTPGMQGERYTGWMSMYHKYNDFPDDAFDFSGVIPHEPELVVDEEYSEEHDESRISGIVILIILATIVLSLILLIAATILANFIKRKRMSPEKLYASDFKNTLLLLNEFDLKMTPGETLEEFAGRTSEVLYNDAVDAGYEEYADKFKDTTFISDYESVIYGDAEVTEEKQSGLVSARDRIMRLLKRHYGASYPLHKLRMYLRSVK
ncbi:MAG: transglutaminase domain-containing protein [Lachnospiraceae bacterium]|nr:transglutaminase domain-containing protein [Lachnospiraceae bacterium]